MAIKCNYSAIHYVLSSTMVGLSVEIKQNSPKNCLSLTVIIVVTAYLLRSMDGGIIYRSGDLVGTFHHSI